MARYPKAQWIGANPNDYSTQKIAHFRIVIHIAEGSKSGTDNWFNNPSAQVSAHFLNPQVGPIQQFVDTDEMAYHCAQWNGGSIGIEHEGLSGQRLNANQIKNLRNLLIWLRSTYKTPLQYTTNPYQRGVIGHGMLPEGALSHPDCPGVPILVQVQSLLASIRYRDWFLRNFGPFRFWQRSGK